MVEKNKGGDGRGYELVGNILDGISVVDDFEVFAVVLALLMVGWVIVRLSVKLLDGLK